MTHPMDALDLVAARIIDPLVSVRPNAAIADAHRLMRQRGAPALPVIDGTTQVGSVTLVTAESIGFEGSATLVRDVMDPPLPQLDEHAARSAVAEAIERDGAVLITRDQHPLGLLAADDLLGNGIP